MTIMNDLVFAYPQGKCMYRNNQTKWLKELVWGMSEKGRYLVCSHSEKLQVHIYVEIQQIWLSDMVNLVFGLTWVFILAGKKFNIKMVRFSVIPGKVYPWKFELSSFLDHQA